jgi:hypothetical protein
MPCRLPTQSKPQGLANILNQRQNQLSAGKAPRPQNATKAPPSPHIFMTLISVMPPCLNKSGGEARKKLNFFSIRQSPRDLTLHKTRFGWTFGLKEH